MHKSIVIYLICGTLATLAISLYRRPVAPNSPLRALSLPTLTLTTRLAGRPNFLLSDFGLIVSFLLLAIPAGLRYGIGTDYLARYLPEFLQIRDGGSVATEPGFVLLNRVALLFSSDPQGIFLLTAVLTIGLYYRFFIRMSLSPTLSVFIFVFGGFYLESFNLVRQALAAAILLNTIEYALRHKYVRFILLTLIATTIHSSAIVWLAVLPMILLRVNRTTRTVLTLLLIGVILVAPQMLQATIEQVAPNYSWYFSSNYGETRKLDPVYVITTIAVDVFTIFVIQRSHSDDQYGRTVANLTVVNVAVLIATLAIAYLFSRLNYYFAPIQLIGVPLAIAMLKSRASRNLMSMLLLAAYTTSFIFEFLVWNAHGVLPYEWVFSR